MKNGLVKALTTGFILVFLSGNSNLVSASEEVSNETESTALIAMDSAPAKLIQKFHKALRVGDETTLKMALAEEVLIYEGGNAERSLADYVSHHMYADIAYLKSINITLKEHQLQILGDIAISTAITHSKGEYKNKKIDTTGMETMVLAKQGDGNWKIIHIHWS